MTQIKVMICFVLLVVGILGGISLYADVGKTQQPNACIETQFHFGDRVLVTCGFFRGQQGRVDELVMQDIKVPYNDRYKVYLTYPIGTVYMTGGHMVKIPNTEEK